MLRSMKGLRLLASGAILLGLFQSLYGINFNQIWFQFLTSVLNLLVTIMLGADSANIV